ncbi:Uncharacterised protein [Vibrio cholerae]|nr:Uncharacterised protein [Vibrio cholerae]
MAFKIHHHFRFIGETYAVILIDLPCTAYLPTPRVIFTFHIF